MVTPTDINHSTLRVPVKACPELDAWKNRVLAKKGVELEKYILSTKTTMDGLKVRDKFAKDLLTKEIQNGYVPELFNYTSGYTMRPDLSNPETRELLFSWIRSAIADPTSETADLVLRLVASQDVLKLATGVKNVEILKNAGHLTVREEQAKLTLKKIKE